MVGTVLKNTKRRDKPSHIRERGETAGWRKCMEASFIAYFGASPSFPPCRDSLLRRRVRGLGNVAGREGANRCANEKEKSTPAAARKCSARCREESLPRSEEHTSELQ